MRDAIARADADVDGRRRRPHRTLRRGRGDRRDARPTRSSSRCSSRTTRSARCNPRAEVAAAARERGAIVHVDACAAAGHLPVDFRALDADLCSVTAHKLGGPKGAGALLVRRGLRLDPLARRRRAGTGAAGRHRRRARVGRLRRRVRGGRPRRPRPTAQRALHRGARPGDRTLVPDVARFGPDDPARRAARTCCASASTAWRPSRSCSRSISTAWPCTRDRRARRRRWSRRRCSPRWVSTPTIRCGFRSVGRHRRRRRAIRGSVPGNRRTTQGVASAMTAVRRLNHAVLYVRDARTQRRLLRGGVRLRGRRRVRRRRRGLHARRGDREPPRSRAVHDRRRRRPGRSRAAPASTTSRGKSTRSRISRRCASGC